MRQNLKLILKRLSTELIKNGFLVVIIFFSVSMVIAWSPPTQAPPLGNVEPPINTSNNNQTKTGDITLWNLTAAGAITSPQFCIGGSCISTWSSGGASTPVPSFLVTGNQNQPISGVTLVNWSSETFDTNNNFNLTTDQFTPTVAGKYLIKFSAYCEQIGASTPGNYCQVFIYKNGTEIAQGAHTRIEAGTKVAIPTVDIILDMNGTTDYVDARVGTDATGANILPGPTFTYFTGTHIPSSSGGASSPFVTTGNDIYNVNTGKVGVGTTSPRAKLSVKGDGTGTGLTFLTTGSSNGTGLSVLDSGNVGVGTVAPSQLLTLESTGNSFIDFSRSGSVKGLIGAGTTNQLQIQANSIPIVLSANGFANEHVRIEANGNVGIGGNSPGYPLSVWGPSNNWAIVANPWSGNYGISSYGSVYAAHFVGPGYLSDSAWQYGSDKRLKENINYFDGGLDKISKLQPAKFDYIKGSKKQLGFVAQDVQNVIPEAVSVTDEKTGMLGLKTDFIIPYLVNAIKELNQKIVSLFDFKNTIEMQVSDQQKQLDRQQRMIEELQNEIKYLKITP